MWNQNINRVGLGVFGGIFWSIMGCSAGTMELNEFICIAYEAPGMITAAMNLLS
jgi:hypothetical protein